MQLSDTHCHLNFNSFDDDRSLAIERARQAGVHRILNPGIDIQSSRAVVLLAAEYPEVYAAVGVHPNDSSGWRSDTLAELRVLARQPKVMALGEIGLDYYRDRTPQAEQRTIFVEQLKLAAELELPVVIHNRQAGVDVLAILSEWCHALQMSGSRLASRPGVLHSFSEDLVFARRAIELNFFIGITGPVTFKKAIDLQTVVRSVPLESILIETDAPFLTPHPYRGQRNEPAHVRYVADKIAEIHNLEVDMIASTTTNNAARLFNW